MYKSSDIINVWPAYSTSDPKHIVFVVETEIMVDPEISLDLDIFLCEKGSQGSRVSENRAPTSGHFPDFKDEDAISNSRYYNFLMTKNITVIVSKR
jgi:hypothetical protein